MENQASESGQRHRSIILLFLIAAAIGIYLYIQFQKSSSSTPPPKAVAVGQPAPDFALPLLDGKEVRLSDYKGKIVFLNIWATWCGPCKEEMPSMEKLYQALKGQAFEILAVSIDDKGAAVVAPFVKAHNLTFPVLLDRESKTRRLYGATGVPETFIIDKNGIIVSKIIGYRDWSTPDVVQKLGALAANPAGTN